MSEFLTHQKYQTLAKNISENSYACENCGHKEIIRFDQERRLCTYCKHYIYKSEEIKEKYKFMEKMRGAIKNAKRNEKN